MNCTDIERLLDDGHLERLGAAEHAAADAHLATCRDCALEWQAHARMAATAIPAMPADLVQRCRARFVATAGGAGGLRAGTRPLVLVGLFLGAAAAALGGAQRLDTGRDNAGARSTAAPASATISPDTPAGAEAPTGAAAARPTQRAAADPTDAEPTPPAAQSPDAFVLAVSPLEHAHSAAAVRAITAAILA
jgi:hypothetical protein